MRKTLQNSNLSFFISLSIALLITANLSAQQIILPVEVLGAEGKVVTRTFDLSSQEATKAAKIWLQVNNLSYQNKASVKINNGAWLTLNHQNVTMQAQEKARGGMVHGGFNTIRFSIPAVGFLAGSNTISFRFDLSDAISNGYRVVKFNLLDGGSNKILPDTRFKQDDPLTWTGPYTDAISIQEGKNLWYNGNLKSNYLPIGRKGFWYGAEVKGQEVINAKCASCHVHDGRDLEIFSYSNESIVERAKFHQLTDEEGKKIASYIRSLSTAKPNVGRWGRPWNPPYQPGPAVANMPVQQWAAGAGLDAVLDEDKDMVPYLFPNGVNQAEVYNHFDSDKTLDRTTLPLAIQFPDWKHWLPMIHPMDAYSKNDYYNQPGKQYDPKKGYTDFRNYLTAQDPSTRNKAELMQKSGEFRTNYRFFLAQGSPSGIGGHWRTTDGTATANLADGVSREMAATSLARLLAVQYFEIFNEFNLQDKANWFTKPGEYPGDLPKSRQWFGDDYHVFEVPPHFQACVNNDCNQFVGQPTATGFYESTNWYHLQLVISGGDGMMNGNSPVDYNYHPDFMTKASNSSGIYEPLRYYHSMNAMYQTRTWVGGQSPNDGKGFRIRVMGPWNIYGITDGNQFNGFAPGEFAKLLDKVEPGMTAWVMNAMLKQFLKEVNKPYNNLAGWNRLPDGGDNELDRANKTYADIIDAVQRTERQETFFLHYAAKMYYYIPRFQKLGVDCQVMEDLITWCQAAWPLIDWSVFRNKGEMQISPQLKDNTFCSGTNIIKAIGTNLPANPVFTWKVNGVTSSTTGVELTASNINPGDIVTCQITTTSTCVAIKTVQATIVMPSKGYNLTMRKVGEANFRPLGNISGCTTDKIELKLNIDLQPKQWLDAMDVNSGTEPANGSKIASWWDKTSHGFNADANKTELQPTYLTNGLNGLPAIVFGNDNNADGLELFTTTEDAFLNNDWTIMFVGQSELPPGNTDWRDIIGNKTEGANGWFWRFGGNARVQMGIGNELQHGKEYNFGRSYIVQITKKGDVITCYLNGRSDRVITKGSNVAMRISDAVYIGQSAGGNQFSNRYHKGPIAELMVFESAITDAQKEFLEGYLTNKWKLNNELDYTHTYSTNSPFDITANAPDGSTYKFDAVTTSQTINLDNTNKFGTYNFVKQVCGATVETISVTNACVAQSPYGGTPWPIPGKIEVENFDLGGEGIAYHDNEIINYGGAFRTTEGVDVGNCIEGGYNIGFIGGGEWTEYTVIATKTSVYTLDIRVATPNAGKSLHIEVDGINVSGTIAVPVTGSWDTYQTVSVTTSSITVGLHVVKIVMDTDGFNFNYVDFIINGAPIISSNSNATGVIGKPFKYTVIASNNPTSFSASGLPIGLTINTSTGVISGTTAAAGTYTVTVNATNGVATVSKLVTVTIKSKMDIAPFGDSITQSNEVQTSYRYPLWKKMIDANIPFNYVGSMSTNFNGNPTTQVPYNGIPFDSDNEGHWGIGTNDFANNYIANWSNLYSPDLVLLHLGTNDVATVSTTTSRDNLIRIISRVREVNPNVVIFIAQIIPRGGTVYTAYNDMIAALGASLNTTDSPIIVVDQVTGFNTTTDTWDGTHPNASGDEKMAVRWFEAINTYLNPVPVQSPSGGTAWPIPGKIEVENFDNGGEGIAYHDNETINYGGAFRATEGVDVGNCPEGSYNIGWIGNGEWTEYTVNVSTTAAYTLEARVATPNASRSFHLELDGVNISGSINVPLTNSWDTYQTVSVTTSNLTAGQHILRMYVDAGDFNINYINFAPIVIPPIISSAATATGIIGTAFSYTIIASNTPTSFGATGLPTGLTVNSGTGAITGTPTTSGTFTTTVTATNAGGTGSKTVTITIGQAPPVISSAATATGTTGTAFTYTITASNSPASYGATGLPAGLTVNTSTGVISGTPTTAGTFTTTVTATNAGGTGTKSVAITISQAPPVISSAATATGTTGTAFTYAITASNSPLSYIATGLPAGLTVNASTGVISGTPTTAGTFTTTITATNAGGTGTKAVTITISIPTQTPYGGTAWPIPGKIEVENFDNGGEGIAYHDNETTNNGGAFRTSEGVDVGNCPDGTYNIGFIGTGEWTEYTVNVATTAAYTLEARVATPNASRSFHLELDGVNISGSINVPLTNSWDTYQSVSITTSSLTVGQHILRMYVDAGDFNLNYINFAPIAAAPIVSSAATSTGIIGTAFSYTILASNTPTSFGATGLPIGLTVNSVTGAITGTPTTAGTFTSTVTATNAGGTGTKTITITIGQAPPVISSAATATGTTGTAFTYTITASNSPASYSATGLPTGLTLNTSTGVISGTPTTVGTFTTTVTATNAGGTGNKTLSITVINPVSTPYLETPWSIPGTIQAENFDDGGEGLAYHDNDAANNGAQQRTNQGVDVEITGDNLGGTYNIGFTNAGEWMVYTVNVQTSGVYTLQARVAAPGAGSSFRVELDGTILGSISVPNTAGWQTYQTISVITPTISAGPHKLRIYEETGGFNINYISFVSGAPLAPVITSATSANAILGNAFTYTISASNNPTSYNATGLPSGLTINTNTGVISGTPVNSGTSIISISATNATGTGTVLLTYNVTVLNDPAATITAYKNTNTITVNGNLNEPGWNLNKTITKTVFGTANNIATFGALWDNTNLYIGVKVLDGNLYFDSPDWWEDDAIELYIDANNNKLSTYDGQDNQIIKGYNKSGVSTKLNITGLQHAWAAILGGYTIEFAIPWSQLGISPTSSTSIGFDIGYDDDDNGGTRDGQVMWNGIIDNWQNTSQFGTLKLNTGFAARFGENVTSLEYAEVNSVIIQPNIITNGILNVLVPSVWSGNTEISILNANGLLLQTSLETITTNFVTTNISGFKQGIYFMKITKDAEVFTGKFIVQ